MNVGNTCFLYYHGACCNRIYNTHKIISRGLRLMYLPPPCFRTHCNWKLISDIFFFLFCPLWGDYSLVVPLNGKHAKVRNTALICKPLQHNVKQPNLFEVFFSPCLHLKYLISAKLFVSGNNSYLDSLRQDLMMFVLNRGGGKETNSELIWASKTWTYTETIQVPKKQKQNRTARTLQPSDKTTFTHKSWSECGFSPGERPLGGFYDLMLNYCGNYMLAAVRGACVCRGKRRWNANKVITKKKNNASCHLEDGCKIGASSMAVMSGCSCSRMGRCPRRQVEASRKRLRFSKACKEPNNPFQAITQVFTGRGENRLQANVSKILTFRRNKNTQRLSLIYLALTCR